MNASNRIGRRAALCVLSGAVLVPIGYALLPVRSAPAVTRPPLQPVRQAVRSDLALPPRAADAMTGSAFATRAATMSQEQREELIEHEILAGNVPDFLRRFVPIDVASNGHVARLQVLPDHLAIGSNDDFLRIPMQPNTAQRIADACGCFLPTTKLVDEIYRQAEVRWAPVNLPLAPEMTTSVGFMTHQRKIEEARREGERLGALTAGDKKDVVITNRLEMTPDRVAIYGWHLPDGHPLQPLCLEHIVQYVDYSHGIRLVSAAVVVDGKERRYDEVLASADLAPLLSDEGPIANARYRT